MNLTLTLQSDTELNLTKLDVLDSFPKIKIAIGYKDEQGPQMGYVHENLQPNLLPIKICFGLNVSGYVGFLELRLCYMERLIRREQVSSYLGSIGSVSTIWLNHHSEAYPYRHFRLY
jgi:hypothetical protein